MIEYLLRQLIYLPLVIAILLGGSLAYYRVNDASNKRKTKDGEK